jgi:ATP-dependent Clp protease protease subunit
LDATRGEIGVVLCTGGGHVAAGFAIYDALRLTQNKTLILGMGEVKSIGTTIMQAADRRLVTENTELMVHEMIMGLSGDFKAHEVVTLREESDRCMESLIKILSKRSKLDEAGIRFAMRRTTTYSAQEALEAGLIDGIVDSKRG